MKLKNILDIRVFAPVLLCSVAVVPAEASPPDVHYKHTQKTGVARAFCPPGMPVIGGGGFVETPSGGAFKEEKLRQTYPISDKTGVIAFANTAIGWQVASSDFTDDVAAFAICAASPLSSLISVQYVSAQSTGVARAFCPIGTLVVGGGGFVESPPEGGFKEEKLRQTFPISDATGVIAYGTTAIGWQAASSDFSDTVVSFAVCATPTLGSMVSAQYISSQSTGVARAFCPVGITLTGGGAIVETPQGGGFKEEKLRQTYPISDASGVIAYGTTAIGWQAASSDFNDTVVSFAICTSH